MREARVAVVAWVLCIDPWARCREPKSRGRCKGGAPESTGLGQAGTDLSTCHGAVDGNVEKLVDRPPSMRRNRLVPFAADAYSSALIRLVREA